MGGVALIVFLFAAMRKNMEQQVDVGNVSVCEIKITSEGAICPDCYVGQEIGFCICDADDLEKEAYLGEKNENGKFSVDSRSCPSPQFKFAIVGKMPEMAKIRVWLKDLHPNNKLPDAPLHYELRYNNNLLTEGDLKKENNYIVTSDAFNLE